MNVRFVRMFHRHPEERSDVGIQNYAAPQYRSIIKTGWPRPLHGLAMTWRRLLSIAIFIILIPVKAFSLEDGLQKAIEIAAQGNNIQSERLKIVAENIANEYTTGEFPGSKAYRRKVMFVENKYDKDKKTNLLRVKKYSEDPSPFELKYDPNHPAANAEGYVNMPNVRREIERSDAAEAQRAYEANLGVIEMSRFMIQKSLETIR